MYLICVFYSIPTYRHIPGTDLHLTWHAINLKHRWDPKYILPIHSDTHIRASTSSSTIMVYSDVWVVAARILGGSGGCYSSSGSSNHNTCTGRQQRWNNTYLTYTTPNVFILKHISKSRTHTLLFFCSIVRVGMRLVQIWYCSTRMIYQHSAQGWRAPTSTPP